MAELSRRTAEERSIAELLGELSHDIGLLVRQEAQLAKTEMQATLSRVATDVASLATGGGVAMLGGLALTAALVLFLIDPVGLKPWLSALVVAVVMLIIGSVLLRRGIKDLKATDPTPRRTVETIKEDIQWAKEQRP
jgi:xanthine/uracil permease